MMFYNEKLSTWEPLIEPVMEKEGVYRPWEVLIKVGVQMYRACLPSGKWRKEEREAICLLAVGGSSSYGKQNLCFTSSGEEQ